MTTKEQIDALVKALEAGAYKAAPGWEIEAPKEEKPKKDDKYPHKCPKCGGPAYIGFSDINCKNKCR